jgi:CO/xanthine dehydrogenase FAD-binding subunit
VDLPAVEQLIPAAPERFAEGDAFLAGGTWLFSEPQPGVRRLHDLTALGWPAITASAVGMELAATCTFAELAAYRGPSHWPATRVFRPCCEALLGSFKVWHAATVGGNLCLALAAAPMAALAVALDARCEIWSPGGTSRTLDAIELITGPGETSLADGELLRAIHLPAHALGEEVAIRQMSLSPVGRSAALLIGRRAESGALTLTVTAAVPRPVRIRFAGPPTAAELGAALQPISAHPYDDVHGDPRWRAHLIGLLGEEIRAELESRG